MYNSYLSSELWAFSNKVIPILSSINSKTKFLNWLIRLSYFPNSFRFKPLISFTAGTKASFSKTHGIKSIEDKGFLSPRDKTLNRSGPNNLISILLSSILSFDIPVITI